eukprot:m.1126266 g.1126266  ORF g.1126266 m.1126266 type:complete len:593 (+) comp24411_c0_seq2:103-1881(+)
MPLCSSSRMPIPDDSPVNTSEKSAMQRGATKERPLSMLPVNFSLQQVSDDQTEVHAECIVEDTTGDKHVVDEEVDPVHPQSRRNSDSSTITMMDGSDFEGESSNDRGYLEICTLWLNAVDATHPTFVWSSEYIAAGEGWEKQTGVLVKERSRFQKAKSISAVGAGAGGAAAAGLVIASFSVGLALAGTGIYFLRSRHLRLRDKLSGSVHWIEWQHDMHREASITSAPNSDRSVARHEYVTTLDPLGKPMPLRTLGLNTAIRVSLHVPRKESGFITCMEIFNDGDYNGAQLQLITHKGTANESGEVNLFTQGVLAQGCRMDALINYDTLTDARFAKAESCVSGEYNFWIAISKKIIAIGFGKNAFEEVRYMFELPKTLDGEVFSLSDKLQYRLISHKMRHNLELSGSSSDSPMTATMSETNFVPEMLRTSLTKKEAATAIIDNLEYHMRRGRGMLRKLRGERYIHSADTTIGTEQYRVILTTGHIVLLRKATGLRSKLHVHTQYRMLGALALEAAHSMDKVTLAIRKKTEVLRIMGVDGSSLLLPLPDHDTIRALLWQMGGLERGRQALAENPVGAGVQRNGRVLILRWSHVL